MQKGKTVLGLDNNVGALVCYLNICLPLGLIYSIIVLVTDKTNKLPRFHALNSILLGLAGTVVIIGLQIFAAIVAVALNSAIISMLIGLVVLAVALGLFAAFIFSAVKAYQGQLFKLPVIGDLADKWSN
jgi:uncharacterized membrane protein